MVEQQFGTSFFLLQREGYLTRGCLTDGLTTLRGANIGDLGKYYTGFFLLSIGIERFAKLILIVRHMASHDLKTPSGKEIRSFGHDLVALLDRLTSVAPPNLRSQFDSLALDSVERDLLHFLSRFARYSRYHNLDSLAKGERQPDPLSEWNEIALRIIKEDMSSRQQDVLQRKSNRRSLGFQNVAHPMFHDLDRQSLSISDLAEVPLNHEFAVRYAVLHFFQILKPMRQFLEAVTDEAQKVNQEVTRAMRIPYMGEFFTFLYMDRSTILRRKTWS